MALTRDDVRDIAHLARLGFDDTELDGIASDLSTVLDLVEQMSAVDTQGVEPMAHPGDPVLKLRTDEVTESNQRELLQSPAPAVEQGYFLVPRVVE